jgi:hypothetical protein
LRDLLLAFVRAKPGKLATHYIPVCEIPDQVKRGLDGHCSLEPGGQCNEPHCNVPRQKGFKDSPDDPTFICEFNMKAT